MGNIMDNAISMPCHPKNKGGDRPASAIKYLVFHYTGNDGDTAYNNARYYQTNVVQASAHYFVDDDSVVQSVKDLGIAWAVGGKKWADADKTGGGSLFLVATNYNTISIEMCDTRRNGQLMASEATLERAVRLGRALMEKYNIPIDRVIRHFDVTGKHCPAYFMDSNAWSAFKERLTVPPPPVPWYASAQEWAVSMGIAVGTDKGMQPEALCSRAEVWAMLQRYHEAATAARGGD